MLFSFSPNVFATFAVTCAVYLILRWCRATRAIFTFRLSPYFSPVAKDGRKRVSQSDSDDDDDIQSSARSEDHKSDDNARLVDHYRQLYYQLHNLEDFPEILSVARTECFSLLRRALAAERCELRQSCQRSILGIREYDGPATLEKFLSDEQDDVLAQWEAYNQRRREGGGRELLPTREAAERWLVEIAPLKYVDGAWLGHVHKLATPFALRHVTKAAWQVLSEELGDGDLSKNHVHIYRTLLNSIGVRLPPGDSAAFVAPRHDMNRSKVWTAAVAQLLISLFPNDLLPEILGFNMHFELLTLETLQASKELPELNISGYYFTLHVSIDNADSGHTAMACAAVTAYLDLLQRTPGGLDPQQAWRRIQAGYLLSQRLGRGGLLPSDSVTFSAPIGELPSMRNEGTNEELDEGYYEEPLTPLEARVVNLLLSKAAVSRRIHCASKLHINKRPLADWLAREAWQTRREFLDAFAEASPWIRRGDSNKSLLIRELSWCGKMFGAFTHTEITTLRQWIDTLPPVELKATSAYYWSVIGGELRAQGKVVMPDAAASMFTALSSRTMEKAMECSSRPSVDDRTGSMLLATMEGIPQSPSEQFTPLGPFALSHEHIRVVLPLWFAHSALLENMVTIPYRTATPLQSQVVILLRTELGFMPETASVAGMDEHLLPGHWPSIVELGLEMLHGHSPQDWRPSNIQEVLDRCHEEICSSGNVFSNSKSAAHAIQVSYRLLDLARKPLRHRVFLLGLSRAFLDLEISVAMAGSFLSDASRSALQDIVARKMKSYDTCFALMTSDKQIAHSFVHGYRFGHSEIKSVLDLCTHKVA